jgi:hypothetical protein
VVEGRTRFADPTWGTGTDSAGRAAFSSGTLADGISSLSGTRKRNIPYCTNTYMWNTNRKSKNSLSRWRMRTHDLPGMFKGDEFLQIKSIQINKGWTPMQ